ncbi:MAG: histidine--tRNA ligase [Candidatus Wildermuthbacteria bacterium RIFCSPLOWO2_02_FULL_47_10]|nr:MAG: histidine--tRNA ligase [Candidatus Wildermuthbacteria bacterium RIFCSPLOWO2_02_FULL_47_10]
MKQLRFQTPTGTHDILPEDEPFYQRIMRVAQDIAQFYGFQKIETPILEQAELFSRGVGLSPDIVEKQMYTLRTRGGDLLTLRPEGTAPVARAYTEHGMINLPQPVKLWYWGPFFRYEHPQAGRLRQFYQFGLEVFGEESAAQDAQIIQIFYAILQELRLKDLVCEINSIGDNQCRPYYKKMLVSYFKSKAQGLCIDCRRRLKENPLRILDCKEEKCQRTLAQAPQMIDHLCEECHKHLKEVLEFLDEIAIPYHLNPFLVRGLDYYTKTVFEIYEGKPTDDQPRQTALAGGGRFDGLLKIIGGRPMPACGGAAGVERIITVLKARQIKMPAPASPKVFLAQLGVLAKRKALKLLEELRRAGIAASESVGKDSLKTQLGRANKIQVKYTLILGQREALEGSIIIREMESGRQETVKIEKVVGELKKRLKK